MLLNWGVTLFIPYSSTALPPVFRPWRPRCRGFETTEVLWGKGVSPMSSPQPWGSLSLSLSRTSIKSCQAWMALPAARLPPEQRSSSVVHTSSLTRRKTPSTTWRYQPERLWLFKLICVPKPHNVSFLKIPSLFHTTKGISKLNNWDKPSPTENFNSLNLACCKHQVVDNRRATNCDSLLRCHVT